MHVAAQAGRRGRIDRRAYQWVPEHGAVADQMQQADRLGLHQFVDVHPSLAAACAVVARSPSAMAAISSARCADSVNDRHPAAEGPGDGVGNGDGQFGRQAGDAVEILRKLQ